MSQYTSQSNSVARDAAQRLEDTLAAQRIAAEDSGRMPRWAMPSVREVLERGEFQVREPLVNSATGEVERMTMHVLLEETDGVRGYTGRYRYEVWAPVFRGKVLLDSMICTVPSGHADVGIVVLAAVRRRVEANQAASDLAVN